VSITNTFPICNIFDLGSPASFQPHRSDIGQIAVALTAEKDLSRGLIQAEPCTIVWFSAPSLGSADSVHSQPWTPSSDLTSSYLSAMDTDCVAILEQALTGRRKNTL
jgi:hypothetical protein